MCAGLRRAAAELEHAGADWACCSQRVMAMRGRARSGEVHSGWWARRALGDGRGANWSGCAGLGGAAVLLRETDLGHGGCHDYGSGSV